MNVYFIDAGTYTYKEIVDRELGGPIFEDRAIHLIAAPNRNRAKTLFFVICEEYRRTFAWTSPMTIRLIERDVDEPEGRTDDQALWLQANRIMDDRGDTDEWRYWEAVGDLYYEDEPVEAAL